MNPALPILYSFRRCPYAMRARMAIAHSGVKVQLREVLLRDKPPQLLALSPKGTVPVLVLADGSVIEESREIMDWALAQSDPNNWRVTTGERGVSASPNGPHSLDSWIAENDGPFKSALDHYKYSVRFPEKSQEDYRVQGEVFLRSLENSLQLNPYLMGDRVTIADIAVFPFIRQFALVDKDWFEQASYLRLQSWLRGFLGSALFAQVMHKYPQWQADDPISVFPATDITM